MTTIKEHLQFLYGKNAAQTLYPRLLECLKRHSCDQETQGNATRDLGLSQRDALVITYGDQVREPDKAPLVSLADFFNEHLRRVVSGTHILPFYPYSSDDGFSVTDWLAVDPALGTWENISELGHSFELMFDAVFNHLSAESVWFRAFLRGDPAYRDFFVTVTGEPDLSQVVRPRALPLLTEFESAAGPRKVWTTFSADQVDLNFKNPEVLLATLDALLFYARHGARFIRLDAIAYLWKEIGTSCIHLPQTHRVIQLLRAALDEVAPQVVLITETNVPHTDNISYFGDGSNEAQLVYNFALPPLVLHSLATGNARELTNWAAALKLPSDRTAFFNFLASHDGIGVNPARGILSATAIDALVERTLKHGGFVSYKHNSDGSKSPYELNINFFDVLSNPNDTTEPIETQVDRFMVTQAIMLALAGMPGIYFHSLFGSRNDRAGAESSGIPRRINRQKLERAGLERALTDPTSLRARIFSRYKQLLRIRREQSAFHPTGKQEVLAVDERVFAVMRESPDQDQRILCLHNVSHVRLQLKLPTTAIRPKTRWTDLFSGQQHWANGEGTPVIELAPYQVFWARQNNP